jgi:hypothetical protein
VARQPKGELVPVVFGFNYDLLETKLAEQVRSSADRIWERVKKTVEDIIEVGNDLLAVKEALEHGSAEGLHSHDYRQRDRNRDVVDDLIALPGPPDSGD